MTDYSLTGGTGALTESLSDLLAWRPSYSLVDGPGGIQADNRGFSVQDTAGQEWGTFFQGLLGDYVRQRFSTSQAPATVTGTPIGVGVTGQPVAKANYMPWVAGGIVLGVFLLAKAL